jgi:hypothetical protein
MTDHLPNDLSHLSDEEFCALCPQGEHAPGPQPLTPAAQAVMDAYWQAPLSNEASVAAALRSVADQVVDAHDGFTGTRIYDDIYAIADELEAMS